MRDTDIQRRADQREAADETSKEKDLTQALDVIWACVEYHSLPAILKEAGKLILEKHRYAKN